MQKVISTVAELDFEIRTLSAMPIARNVLMVKPTYFNVDNPINAHMRAADGSLHKIDTSLVQSQWLGVKTAYENLGLKVKVIEGGAGLPDMVFCANQFFPCLSNSGEKLGFLSNMHNDIRHKEVPLVQKALEEEGYKTSPIAERSSASLFEAMGDALWLPGRRFILGGYGFRTTKSIYNKLTEISASPVAVFELKNPRFYHLDTCLSVVNETTAMACREAFTDEGWMLLKGIFNTLIEIPLTEADSPAFAGNAHCPDGKHVILQKGSIVTEAALRKAGLGPVAVDTSEFIKSGGSVFCMKLMFF